MAAMKLLLVAMGWLCMVIGILGVFLPVLPGTPFLLLAAACFVRSSPRMHARLLANRYVGPLLEQWHRERSVPRAAKRRAYALVVVSFAISVTLAGTAWARIVLVLIGTGLLIFLIRLPTTPAAKGPSERAGE